MFPINAVTSALEKLKVINQKFKAQGPHENESSEKTKTAEDTGRGNLDTSEYLEHPNVFAMWRYLKPNMGASTGPTYERDYMAEGNAAAEVTAKYCETLRKRLVGLQAQFGDGSQAAARHADYYCSRAQVVATVADEYAEVLSKRIKANLNACPQMDEQKLAVITSKEFAKIMNTRLAKLQKTANITDDELLDCNSLDATIADDIREQYESVLQTRLARIQNECFWANPLGIAQRDAQQAHQEPSSYPAVPLHADVNNPVFTDADFAGLTKPRLSTPAILLIPTTKAVAGIATPLINTATFPLRVNSGRSKFQQLTLRPRRVLPTAMAGSRPGAKRLKVILNTKLDLAVQSHMELDASTDAVGLPSPVASTSVASTARSVAVVPQDLADELSTGATTLNATPTVSAKDKPASAGRLKTVVVGAAKKESHRRKSALPCKRPKPTWRIPSHDAFSFVSPTQMTAKAFSSKDNTMTAKASNADATNLAASVGLELCVLPLKALPKAGLSGRATYSPYAMSNSHTRTTGAIAVALGSATTSHKKLSPIYLCGGKSSQISSAPTAGLGSYVSALSPHRRLEKTSPSAGSELDFSPKVVGEAGKITSSHAEAVPCSFLCSSNKLSRAATWETECPPTKVTDLNATSGAASLESQGPSNKAADLTVRDACSANGTLSISILSSADFQSFACPMSSTVRPQLDPPPLSAEAVELAALQSSTTSDTKISRIDDPGGEMKL